MALKGFEVEMERLVRWDGKYPSYLLQTGGGEGNGMLLTLPQPIKTTATEQQLGASAPHEGLAQWFRAASLISRVYEFESHIPHLTLSLTGV